MIIHKLSKCMVVALILTTAAIALGQSPVTQKLASGTYVVYAPSPQIWRVKVDPQTMSNVTISGHFVVTEGTPKNIEAFVFNEANYTKWSDDDPAVRAEAKSLASSSRTAEGDVNAKLTDAGYHFLVLSNRYQYEGRKTVSTDIKLQYDKR